MKKKTYGFTLVELLVVILIIGILTAVAVPMYKHAVLKSRFSTVMALAKSLAAAQEVYYLGNGIYSDNLAELDVSAVGNASGRSATLQDGTTVALGDTEVLKYVMTGKSDLSNHFIIYQKNSKYFPSEIHCEAQKENADANWLCEKGLGGTLVGDRALTSGYNTYVLDGTGNGHFPKTWTNVSNQVLEPGDSCTSTIGHASNYAQAGCYGVTVTDGECKPGPGNTYRSCSASVFDNSVCEGNAASCQFSTFTNNSVCNASAWMACSGAGHENHNAIFNNSTCTGTTGCTWGTFSNNAVCNAEGDACTYSDFDHSVCYGKGARACVHSSFKNGSVCYALSPVAYPSTPCISSSYDATSYCAGDYCPNGSPSGTAGKKWYRGTGEDWPADRPSELVDK